MYGEGSGTILLDKVNCEGTETSLADCGHQGFYKHNCDHSKDVGVICNIRKHILHILFFLPITRSPKALDNNDKPNTRSSDNI